MPAKTSNKSKKALSPKDGEALLKVLKTRFEKIRKLGGAIFGDRRYDHVFVYHNGAQSYYAARAFRGALRV